VFAGPATEVFDTHGASPQPAGMRPGGKSMSETAIRVARQETRAPVRAHRSRYLPSISSRSGLSSSRGLAGRAEEVDKADPKELS
jgi:hypothetical protein